MYYVYILYSLKDKKFYTGLTNNLRIRIKEHQYGKVKSTANRRPIKLIYYEAYILKKDAQNREYYLKTTEGKKSLRKQISNFVKLRSSP